MLSHPCTPHTQQQKHTQKTKQVDLLTDTKAETLKPNQVPFIQSLAASLGVDPSLVYFYNLTTDGDLLRVKGGLFVLLLVFGGLCFNHD